MQRIEKIDESLSIPVLHLGGMASEWNGPDIARTILIAEDNDDLRELMEVFLTMSGFYVVACADAYQAIQAFRVNPAIVLLLTDMEMPGMSGLELARELTAIRPSLPVLFVSGCDLTADMEEEMQERSWIFLGKPYRFPQVLAALEALLDIRQLQAA